MKNTLLVCCMIFCMGCHNPSPAYLKVTEATMIPPPVRDKFAEVADIEPNALKPGSVTLADSTRKIVKTGEIKFETKNLTGTRKRVIIQLKKFKGYIAEENESNGDDNERKEIVLSLRLPSINFDNLVDSISAGAGKIDSKNISTADVTSRYIDIKTAIANKRILENTYLGLLGKVSKVADVLQIENKLTGIRTTIDSTQGQLNYLLNQVAYSSLSVTFYSKHIPTASNTGVLFKLLNAMNDGWELLQNTFFALLAIWPFIVFMVIVIIFSKRWYKGKKRIITAT